MNKKRRDEMIRIARRNGAVIKDGGKHIKVYDQNGHYVASFSHGAKSGYEGRGDMKHIEKKWRQLGWVA